LNKCGAVEVAAGVSKRSTRILRAGLSGACRAGSKGRVFSALRALGRFGRRGTFTERSTVMLSCASWHQAEQRSERRSTLICSMRASAYFDFHRLLYPWQDTPGYSFADEDSLDDHRPRETGGRFGIASIAEIA